MHKQNELQSSTQSFSGRLSDKHEESRIQPDNEQFRLNIGNLLSDTFLVSEEEFARRFAERLHFCLGVSHFEVMKMRPNQTQVIHEFFFDENRQSAKQKDKVRYDEWKLIADIRTHAVLSGLKEIQSPNLLSFPKGRADFVKSLNVETIIFVPFHTLSLDKKIEHCLLDFDWATNQTPVENFPELEASVLLASQIYQIGLNQIRTTQSLRQLESRFEKLAQNSPFPFLLMDQKGEIGLINQQFYRTFGFASKGLSNYEELQKNLSLELSLEEFLNFRHKKGKNPWAKEESFGVHYLRMKTESGEFRHVEVRIGTSDVGLQNIYVIFNDYTEQYEIEEQLRESEAKYRAIAEDTGDIIWTMDVKKQKLTYVSPSTEKILGFSPNQLVGKSISEIAFLFDDGAFFKVLAEKVRTGHSLPEVLELVQKSASGQTILTQSRFSYIYNSKNQLSTILGVTRDVTKIKEQERDRIRANHMESIGLLAGGIAHDFNNILTGLTGSLSMMKKMWEDERGQELLRISEKAVRRAGDLVARLMNVAKGGAPIKEDVDIAALIKDSAEFVLHGSKANFRLKIPADLKTVHIDGGQMSEVIQNLVLNASQAMPEGGEIVVEVEPVKMENHTRLKDGEYLKVSVSDTGTGIPVEDINRIFDPYYTTKAEGNGLGLSSVHSIIQNHGGFINVDSSPGKGTCFTFYLPSTDTSEEHFSSQAEKEKRQARMSQGEDSNKKLLVMDDDEFIRDILAELLRELGYNAEFTQNGEETIQLYRKSLDSEEGFGAVLLDLTIPGGMGGMETLKRLIKIDEKVNPVLCSGYSTGREIDEFKAMGYEFTLNKPYNIDELEEVLQKALLGK